MGKIRSKLSTFIQLAVLCIAVCFVYFPTIRAEPCLLDDAALLHLLQGNAPVELKTIFFPHSKSIFYFRPLIGFSYWCDQTLRAVSTQTMHLENIAFHLLNAVLLFWLIRILLQNIDQSVRYIPFLGALLFAVHPITTEPVSWISGRTDLIAGTCLISSTISVLLWRRKISYQWFLLSLLFIAGAVMSKEVAWGFLLVFPFFLVAPFDSKTYTLWQFFGAFSRLEKLLFLTVAALCFLLPAFFLLFWPVVVLGILLGVVVYYRKPDTNRLSTKSILLLSGFLITSSVLIHYILKAAQQNALNGTYSNFRRTVLLISVDFDNSITVFSTALAFYIKKFFLPLPLSFSITHIASEYLFGGIAVIMLITFLTAWRSQAAILFLAGIVVLLPTLPLVHNQIAWAPYAERYIYISSSFWIASVAVGVSSIKHPRIRSLGVVFCLAVIASSSLISYKRSTTWQTNVALFGDTVVKSPNHLEARVLYMKALSQAGNYPEALDQFRQIQVAPEYCMRTVYFNELAEILYKAGLKSGAWEVLNTCFTKPLPPGLRHPLHDDEWQKLYTFKAKIQQEGQ